MTSTPRDWQVRAKAAVRKYFSASQTKGCMVVAGTGTGKTAGAHYILEDYLKSGARVLWIAAQEELVTQPESTLRRWFPAHTSGIVMGNDHAPHAQVVYASRATLSRSPNRLDDILAFGVPAVVVIDECFPAGTLVDGKPIEDIQVGDTVSSYNHDTNTVEHRKVARLYSRVTNNELMVIHVGGIRVTCTPEHPIFVEGKGYVCAKDIVHGDMLHLLCDVQRHPAATASRTEDVLRDLHACADVFEEEADGLQGVWCPGLRVQEDVLAGMQGHHHPVDGPHGKQGHLLREDEILEEPNVQPGVKGEGYGLAGSHRPQTKGQGREREGSNQVRADRSGLDGRWVLNECDCEHRDEERLRVSLPLQAGCREPNDEDCCGGRRRQPPVARQEGAGQKEGGPAGITRLESVSSVERRSHGGVRVYNIEVEEHHNYFANGVLVHNCHESASKSYRKIIEHLKAAGVTRFLGLTATPERGDGSSLASIWEMVFEYSIIEAINDGCIVEPYLSSCKIPGLDLSKVGVSRGDYAAPELERELMRSHIVEHTVAAIGRMHRAVSLPFRDKTADFDPRMGGIIVHTVTVDQAKATADALNAAGYVARAVWGEMPKGDRKRILRQFGHGIQILCSPAALAQGTDLPWASTSVIARPTRSHRLYVQQFGRVLRPFDGKRGGLTIDLVGSSDLHSLIGAPVLLDGNDCETHTDGQHRYLDVGDGSGWCECGHVIKCYKNGGGHQFKAGKCVHCNAPQCNESPTKNHVWVAWGDGKSKCQFCGHEVRDKLFTLTSAAPVKEPVNWQHVDQGVWAVDLGKVGKMFNVQHGQEWRPLLLARNKVTPLSHTTVNKDLARLLTDDVARQAQKLNGGYGTYRNDTQKHYSRINLAALAKQLKVKEI